MRIAWFIHRYHPGIGGAETYAREMVRRFVASGHDVDVLTSDAEDLRYFSDGRIGRVDAPSEEWVDGARVRRFPVRHFPLQRYIGRALSYVPHWPTRCRWESFMPVLPGIERVRGPYDLVFGVGFPFTVFAFAAWKTARAAGAPLIVTPFLHLATPGDPLRKHYTRPHQARLLRATDRVIAVTELEAATIASWGVPRSRVQVLRLGVDHGAVTGGDRLAFRRRLGLSPDATVIGQLGALDPDKGTCDLVRAVERINARRSGQGPVRLILAGAATPRFTGFLEGLSPETANWLIKLGRLPDEERRDFYAALDVFSMPSRTDSFGIVFLEAWANAKPVVAAASGGVVEVVEHGETGLLAPFGDVEALSRALTSLVEAPETARRLGMAGLTRVSRGHTWEDCYQALLKGTRALEGDRLRVGPREGRTREAFSRGRS